MKIFLVGGAIRNKLLGLPVVEKDWVVVGSTPEEMLSLGFKLVGKDFPVFLHPKTNEEYALARKESKISLGYKGFKINCSSTITLIEDLKRRDITINAIAEDSLGNIIDPFNGLSDIKSKTIRHVSDSFSEDPVRVLRVARFLAKLPNFHIHEETLKLMRNISRSPELMAVNPNRIWLEFEKALREKNPEKFIETLFECSSLKALFPEIYQLFGIPNPVKFHPEIDTGLHSLNALKESTMLTCSPIARFSALIHDIGKTKTNKSLWPNHLNHGDAGVKVIKIFCKRLAIPNKYKETAILTSKFHHTCHTILEATPAEILAFLKKTDALRKPKRFLNFLIACKSDANSCSNSLSKVYKPLNFLMEIVAICKKTKFDKSTFISLSNEDTINTINNKYIEIIGNYIAKRDNL